MKGLEIIGHLHFILLTINRNYSIFKINCKRDFNKIREASLVIWIENILEDVEWLVTIVNAHHIC